MAYGYAQVVCCEDRKEYGEIYGLADQGGVATHEHVSVAGHDVAPERGMQAIGA